MTPADAFDVLSRPTGTPWRAVGGVGSVGSVGELEGHVYRWAPVPRESDAAPAPVVGWGAWTRGGEWAWREGARPVEEVRRYVGRAHELAMVARVAARGVDGLEVVDGVVRVAVGSEGERAVGALRRVRAEVGRMVMLLEERAVRAGWTVRDARAVGGVVRGRLWRVVCDAMR